MADDDAGMSARDRRRDRAKSNAPGGAGRAFKRYRVHLVIVLVFGAILTAMAVNASKGTDCPGHWHSTQDVFVNGERVSYLHGKYDLNGARVNGGSMSVTAHMHNTQGNDYTWHFEPPTASTCVPFGEALDVVDTRISSDTLVLDGAQSVTGTFEENATHELRIYHRVADGDWESISAGKLNDRQLRANERVVIVFGNSTEDVSPYQAQADSHAIESSSGTGGSSGWVPVVGVGILGLIVLGAWHGLSKKA